MKSIILSLSAVLFLCLGTYAEDEPDCVYAADFVLGVELLS